MDDVSVSAVTSNELPTETLAYFQGDELRARVFYDKYALRDRSGSIVERIPTEMWRRVAREMASVEDTDKREVWEQEFYWLLEDFRFIPGGRIMHAAGQGGVGRKAVPINCFVIPIKDDTLDAIYECAREMAITYSRGGGVGTDISILRPAGAVVHNAARMSTGAVSFMETFSLVTGTIGMEGRRGALMLTIRDDHPDVLAFCRIKRDLKAVRYANISVLVSDAFMRAVEEDGDWRLHYENPSSDVFVERTIRARELWNELISGARDWAEPGCLFIDTARRRGTTEYDGISVLTTNPCVTGDTLVSTSEGLIPISELAEASDMPSAVLDGRVGGPLPAGVIQRAWKTGRRRILRVLTREGYELRATAEHPILTDRGWIKTSKLQSGDRVLIQNRKGGFGTRGSLELGRILGWLVGDGYIFEKAERAVLYFYGQKDQESAPLLEEAVAAIVPGNQRYPSPRLITTAERGRTEIQSSRLLAALRASGFNPSNKYDVLPVLRSGSEPMVRGFLQALFTADGTVLDASEARRSVRLTSNNLRLLQDVQLLLLNFGIASRIYKNRRAGGIRPMPNGRGGTSQYPTVPYHELVVAKDNLARFAGEVGFLPGSSKQVTLARILNAYTRGPYIERFSARVDKIVPEGEEDVYDLTEPITHTFIANGMVVHNCGEQWLDPYNNCCLGSLSLLAFVKESFADVPPDDNLDWNELRRAVRAGIRFLDNVVSYADPFFPLEAQREAARRTRRVGLGVTGLGDMLIALRLRYDTDPAIAFAGKVMEFIKIEAYRASVELAQEKGPFPAFQAVPHLAQEFLQDLPSDLRDEIARVGLRNAATMTVPPVGSGAALAGVTSGIEPMFALAYLRRSESLSQERFWVLHPLAVGFWRRFIHKPMPSDTDRFVEEARTELPEFFVTAHEIDPFQRVRMQAAISRHVDNALSSTINLPKETSVEQVGQLYFEAWRQGLKGVTVYRESSREGILITVKEAKGGAAVASEVESNGTASETPIPTATLPIQPAAPAAVASQIAGPEESPRTSPRPRPKVTSGRTERIETPRGRIYVVVNEDDLGVCEVFVHSLDVEAEAIGRLVSLSLRAGLDPREIIEQLWRVQSKEVALDRSTDGTIVRVTTIAQGIALGLGRALYGESFRPDKAFPHAEMLPVPIARSRQERLRFEAEQAAAAPVAVTAGAHTEPNGDTPESNGEVPGGGGALFRGPAQAFPLEFVGICPDCGASLVHSNGCASCPQCGYAKC